MRQVLTLLRCPTRDPSGSPSRQSQGEALRSHPFDKDEGKENKVKCPD